MLTRVALKTGQPRPRRGRPRDQQSVYRLSARVPPHHDQLRVRIGARVEERVTVLGPGGHLLGRVKTLQRLPVAYRILFAVTITDQAAADLIVVAVKKRRQS